MHMKISPQEKNNMFLTILLEFHNYCVEQNTPNCIIPPTWIRMVELKWVSQATTFFGMRAFGALPFGLAPECNLNLGFNMVTLMRYQHVAILFIYLFLNNGCFMLNQ